MRTIIGIIIAAFLGVVAVPAFAEPPASQPAPAKVTKGKKHKRHARVKRAKKHRQARKAPKKHRAHKRVKATAPRSEGRGPSER